MSYTVISLFPIAVDPETVVQKLSEKGINEENINIAKYNIDGTLSEVDTEESKNFWDYLFGDSKWRTAYEKAGIDNNTVTVYADDLETAKVAKQCMDDCGALDIQKYHKENIDNEYQISEEEETRIIAKARHGIYMLDGKRYQRTTSRGKANRMDSMGSKD